jgi:hypothetical protein
MFYDSQRDKLWSHYASLFEYMQRMYAIDVLEDFVVNVQALMEKYDDESFDNRTYKSQSLRDNQCEQV